jgi:hypothetical protein
MYQKIILSLFFLTFFILFQIYFIPLKEAYGETNYESNNFDVQYHDDIATIIEDDPNYQDNSLKIETVDETGEPATITLSSTMGNPTYYLPGEYIYGAASYIPTYTDSILLSKRFNPRPRSGIMQL